MRLQKLARIRSQKALGTMESSRQRKDRVRFGFRKLCMAVVWSGKAEARRPGLDESRAGGVRVATGSQAEVLVISGLCVFIYRQGVPWGGNR